MEGLCYNIKIPVLEMNVGEYCSTGYHLVQSSYHVNPVKLMLNLKSCGKLFRIFSFWSRVCVIAHNLYVNIRFDWKQLLQLIQILCGVTFMYISP